MNVKNNKRKRESKTKIENSFVELLLTRDLQEITITDICELSKLNRSTFYANYLDIYDLVDSLKERLLNNFHELYAFEELNQYNSNDFLKLFQHIQENQLLYKTYFKLEFDVQFKIDRYDTTYTKKYYKDSHVKYHMEFFKAGITAIIKMWLNNDCNLTPEEIFDIIKTEYNGKPEVKKIIYIKKLVSCLLV